MKEGGSLSGEFDVVLIGSQTNDEWKRGRRAWDVDVKKRRQEHCHGRRNGMVNVFVIIPKGDLIVMH